ncbi:hypothetical protein ACFVJ8_19615 [Streptomyces yangpuensis]|uniref:hypothetical protein n=1 Tax=Streptomyces TaxID=1883 RepID=UPI0004C9CF8C|nr:hypothetical protein [Streptomyces sp. NRRL S-378]
MPLPRCDAKEPLVSTFIEYFEERGHRRILGSTEHRFRRLLERGRHVLARPRFHGPLTEEDLHHLHDIHGLPRDLVTTLRQQ